MDSIIAAAARALAGGDPLGALDRVALRDDPDAVALRGIAMAQLGDLGRARELLHAAARDYEDRQPLAHARCALAMAEVALAARDLTSVDADVHAAVARLEDDGDWLNAAHGRLLLARRAVLLGLLPEAETELDQLAGLASAMERPEAAPTIWIRIEATASLLRAEIAVRRVQARRARDAFASARASARRAGVSSLCREVDVAEQELQKVAARREVEGSTQDLRLEDVEALMSAPILIADACRRGLSSPRAAVSLASRPVLWKIARLLCESWPQATSRDVLRSEALEAKAANEAWRTRLRVEVGRLRKALSPIATIESADGGYLICPLGVEEVAVLLVPEDSDFGELRALLADGQAWSTSSLALALGMSQRNVQRLLAELEADGRVRSAGKGRAKRWLAGTALASTTAMLLPRFDP